MNSNPSNTDPAQGGFRLKTFEVWNWGTFDQAIYSLTPEGETSLLTGGNGSGKTTLVDGLLTLLLPERRARAYNQTAGEKGERTEETYLMGEYGETENEVTRNREIKKLRSDKSQAQSVLLAVFQSGTRYVTLAQARWFSGSDIRRSFIIGLQQLSIAEDFMPFDTQGDWKKRLRQQYPKQGSKEVLFFSDSPGEYSSRLQKAFGMGSKAQTLFNKTIGLKVLGNLDEFVRTQMLEERDAEQEFQKIKAHFQTLHDAHTAIEKAYRQIGLLAPIREKSLLLSELRAALTQLEMRRHIAPLWFAQQQVALLDELLIAVERQKIATAEHLEALEQDIEALGERKADLKAQIQLDEVGRQIRDLERDNKRLEQEKSERQKEMTRYNQLAESLSLQSDPQTRELFQEQIGLARKMAQATAQEMTRISEELFQARKEKEDTETHIAQLSAEIQELRAQKNNITGHPARIRADILAATGAAAQDIPFIGELIRVRPEARDWEPAIERVLHNFALRLLVPEDNYLKVNRYVNSHNLGGRIIYHRFSDKDLPRARFALPKEDELLHKLDFKASAYTDWIKHEIQTRYNYLCVENLDAFRLAEKAITREGLLKNATRHEKDDRPEIRNRQQYVLGWDNKEKIALLRTALSDLQERLNAQQTRWKTLNGRESRLAATLKNIDSFLLLTTFQKIDWQTPATQIIANQNTITALEQANDRVNALKKQLDETEADIRDKEKQKKERSRVFFSLESQFDNRSKELANARALLQTYSELDTAEPIRHFGDSLHPDTPPISLDNLDKIRNKVISELARDAERQKDELRKLESAAEGLMRQFRNPEKDILDRFADWNADTHRLSEKVEFIEGYVALLERIEKTELAGYKQQFKKYLNEEMITRMSDFQTWLERHETDIEENIETLNHSLEKINFNNNPAAFIKLHIEKDYSPKVKAFRLRLNEWKPNLAEFERTRNDAILEESFNNIKALLDDLTEDENTRKNVLDVRNWLKFKAVAHHREDPARVVRSFTGTAKLSGGEAAQLTYTILGASIAYQFGIHQEDQGTPSFRFICVDEAFSKQDDEKAQFLMELCKQLQLQVMVVSPAKAEEVAIVEPYIERVHFVQRKDNRHSVVYDMPIRQLREQREQFFQDRDPL